MTDPAHSIRVSDCELEVSLSDPYYLGDASREKQAYTAGWPPAQAALEENGLAAGQKGNLP